MMEATHLNLQCPFCCATFTPYGVRFRCMTPTCRGQATDIPYSRFTGEKPRAQGRILIPIQKRSTFSKPLTEIKCDYCHLNTVTRICPECHMELPADIEQNEAFFIALLGDTSAGKTHYLASLIGYLQNEIGPRLRFSLHPLGEYNTRRWQKRYEPLLNNRHLLESTPTAEEDVQGSYPLSFQLSLDTGISKKNMTLGFFDASGSDVRNQRAILKRYIQNANGVLYFIDPLTIQTISQQIRPASHASASTRDTTREIVQMPRMLRSLFEQEQIITPQEKVNVPTAFVLSKLDTLLPLLYPGCPLLRPNVQQETIAEERLQSINTEVSSLLGAWLGPQFGQLVRSEFTNYGYFSISALGSNPAPNEHTIPSLSPLHIEDPLLWLFAQLQVLKAA